MRNRAPLALLVMFLARASMASAQPAIEIRDFLTMPITAVVDGKGNNEQLPARINAIREETGGAKRLFITDMNGPLYILDKDTKKLTVYLDFNGNEGRKGIFLKLFITQGYGNGLNGFVLDPEYTKNGKFYTVHSEDPLIPGSKLPDTTNFPAFNARGYANTDVIKTPGPVQTECVLIQWIDTNPSNATFEGTARELLRVQMTTRSHPLGDMIFNPAARPGDPDYRVLYVECGDGASGESKVVEIRAHPQRLDTLMGKILRIVPDLDAHTATSTLSENGRYRIPNDNPFVNVPGARKEIWAYGFRNPHRLAWAVDPSNPANNRLIANSVGMHTWESVYIVHKGGNHGYGDREGNEVMTADNRTAPLPADDRLPLRIGAAPSDTKVTPIYPVIQYGHDAKGGDAIGSGFVYNGKAIPSLRGKYIFTDLTTGRIWYADYNDMLAADDGKPATLAAIREVRVRWNDKQYDDMFPIVEGTYVARGAKSTKLPPRPDFVKGARSDVRIAVDADGELYLYSKGDGMIRKVVGATGLAPVASPQAR